MTHEEVEPGDLIYNRGDDINKIYYILKGKVATTYPLKTVKELKELDEAKKEDDKTRDKKTVQIDGGGVDTLAPRASSDLRS